MGRLSPCVAIAGFAVLILTSACGQSPVQPLSQSPANPAPPDTVTPFATVSRTDLGTLGGAASYATDVNDSGIVVGWSKIATGVDHAFRWTKAQGMIDLGTLPGDQWSRAVSITNSGQVLGISGGTAETPVAWDSLGTLTPLPIPLLPGATAILLADHNGSGQVTGSDIGGTLSSHAWFWSESLGIYDITAHIPGYAYESYGSNINGSGFVVGTNQARTVCTNSHTTECWHVFVWSLLTGYRDLGIPVEGELRSAAVTGSAINDLGVVVGWTIPNPDSGGMHPYRWAEGKGFTLLPTFSGFPTYASSVNSAGTAVGAGMDPKFGAIEAAAWPAVGGIVKLSPDDPNPSVAVAVNASGIVVGWSSLGTTNHATAWTLGPGRGASTPTVTSRSRSPVFTAATQLEPAGCLSDPRAVISKQLLIECIVRREN